MDLHEHIKWRPYMIWEQEGRPDGRAEDHWSRAEAEVAGATSGEALPGTPGAGEHICPSCEGSGRVGGRRCKACGGTGRIVEAPEP